MSAAAEVYISIDMSKFEDRAPIQTKIEEVLGKLGFDSTNKERYQVGRYQSGIIVEARSYGCAWEIFEQEWADKLVREIHRLDETADVELYVYNLEREADVQVCTRDLFSENHKEKAHA
jgi:hypothetical protein